MKHAIQKVKANAPRPMVNLILPIFVTIAELKKLQNANAQYRKEVDNNPKLSKPSSLSTLPAKFWQVLKAVNTNMKPTDTMAT